MSGFISAALSLGLGSLVLRPNKRGFKPDGSDILIPQATIEEVHHDEIVITEHPVEYGSNISDHAYKLPPEVIIRFGFSNSASFNTSGIIGSALTGVAASTINQAVGNIAAAGQTISAIGSTLTGNGTDQVRVVYDKILDIQESLTPFTIYTGKRVYHNMLFKSITVNTDKLSENSLMVTATCRKINYAQTQTVKTPTSQNKTDQAIPQSTSPTVNNGTQSLVTTTGFKS